MTTAHFEAQDVTRYDGADLTRRAFAQWFRGAHARLNQPASTSGVREHDGKLYVVLENVNGVLAVYRVRRTGFLRLMKRPPKALVS